ncbi:MAG: hypothetical protein WCK15_19990 [Pirellula sp.]
MYRPIVTQQSCARAWVAAVGSLLQSNSDAYNVIIDVVNPAVHDEQDHAVIKLVDDFLRSFENAPISTVANTLFPQSLYDIHGSPNFYQAYHGNFDRLTDSKRWGRYFERISRHRLLDGTIYNPLQEMIEKLANQNEARSTYRCAYELAVYDPLLDRRMFYGGQCMSFLSFKLHPEAGLMLTAMYRNHTYITRLLGNLIGLGRLLAFVAKEADLRVGSLTVISTHAEVDTGDWGIVKARGLVSKAQNILDIQKSEAN